MSEERALIIPGDAGALEAADLRLSRPAATVIKEAQTAAAHFQAEALRLQLYKQIGPSKHLLVEGWQMLGAIFRVTARVRETREITCGDARGFEAMAEAYHMPTGLVISTADAMCLNDEENWSYRPKYEGKGDNRKVVGQVPVPMHQLRSMAQTRATSKVLANTLKWVARMAGFAGTPADEMTGDEIGDPVPQSFREPRQKQPTISEPQGKRLWAIANEAGRKDDLLAWMKAKSFERLANIPVQHYEGLVTEFGRKGDAQDA